MKYMAKSMLILIAGFGIAYNAAAKPPMAVQDEYMELFVSDLNKYFSCSIAFAEIESDDTSKSPESIAKESHIACKAQFAQANSSSIKLNGVIGQKRSKRDVMNVAREVMSVHKADMQRKVISLVNAKRSKSDT